MRAINVRLVIILAVCAAVAVPGVIITHNIFVGRNASVFLKLAESAQEKAEQLKEEGDAEASLKSYKEALKNYSWYESYQPNDIDTLEQFANLLADLGLANYPPAIDKYEKVLQRIPANQPDRPQVRRKIVDLSMEIGQYLYPTQLDSKTSQDAKAQVANESRIHSASTWYLKARGQLTDLLRKSPDDGELLDKLGSCEVAQSKIPEAEALFRQAIENSPAQVSAYANLANLLRYRLDKAQEADKWMDKMLDANPDSYEACLRAANYALKTLDDNSQKLGMELDKKLEEEASQIGDNIQKRDTQIAEKVDQYRLKIKEESLAYVVKAADLADKALADAEKALQTGRDDSYLTKKKRDAARAGRQQALQQIVLCASNLSKEYQDQEKNEKKLAGADKENAAEHEQLASKYKEQAENNYQLARKSIERGVALYADQPGMYILLSEIDRQSLDSAEDQAAGPSDLAIAALRKGLGPTKNSPDLLWRIAYLQVEAGNSDEAGRVLKQLKDLQKNGLIRADFDGMLDSLQGRIHMAQSHLNEAINSFNKARNELGPRDPIKIEQVDYWLGICYENLGNPDQAQAAFRNAVNASPSYADARVNLADALMRTGSIDKALEEMNKLQRVPTDMALNAVAMIYQKNMQSSVEKRDWSTIENLLNGVRNAAPGLLRLWLLKSEILSARMDDIVSKNDKRNEARLNEIEDRLRTACDKYPDVVDAWVQLIAIVQSRKDWEKVESLFKDAEVKLKEANKDPSKAVDPLGIKIEMTLARARYLIARYGAEAAPQLDKLMDAQKEFSDEQKAMLWNVLIAQAARGGDSLLMENILRALVDKNPDKVEAWVNLVKTVQARKEWEKADSLLNEAEQKLSKPEDRIVLLDMRGQGLVARLGEKASEQLRKLADPPPGFSEEIKLKLIGRLIVPALDAKDFELAKELCRRIAEKQPQNLNVRFLLFQVAYEAKDGDTMKQMATEIRKIEGDGPYWHYAEAFRLIGFPGIDNRSDNRRLDEAVAHLEAAAQARPNWERVYWALGDIYDKQGKLDQALSNYDKAINFGEREPSLILRAAGLHELEGQSAEALRIVELLSGEQYPGFLEINIMKSQLRAKLGDLDKALESARATVANSSDYRGYLMLGDILHQKYHKEYEELLPTVQQLEKEEETALHDARRLSKNLSPLVSLVKFYISTDQKDKAVATVIQANTGKYAPEAAAIPLALSYEALDQQTQAQDQFKAALNASPNDPAVILSIAKYCCRAGKFPQAEALLNRLLDGKLNVKLSDVALARRLMARVLEAQGGEDKLQKAKDLAKDSSFGKDAPQGDPTAITPLFNETDPLEPDLRLAQHNLDAALVKAKNDAANSNDPQKHLLLGRLLDLKRQPLQSEVELAGPLLQESEKAFLKALELNNDTYDTWVSLIKFYGSTKQMDKAEDYIGQIVKKVSAAESPFVLAQCYQIIDNKQRAQKEYERALAETPDNSLIAFKAAKFFGENHDYPPAEEQLRRIIEGKIKAEENRRLEARNYLVQILVEQGGYYNLQKALKIVEEDLAINPSSGQNRRAKAMILGRLPGRGGEAIAEYEKIVGLPKIATPDDRHTLANLYLAQGKWSNFISTITGLLASSQDNKNYPFYLKTYVKALLEREPENVEPWLDRLQSIAPGDFEVVSFRAVLLMQQAGRLAKSAAGKPDEEAKILLSQAGDKVEQALAVVKTFVDNPAAAAIDRPTRMRAVADCLVRISQLIPPAQRKTWGPRFLEDAESFFRQFIDAQPQNELFMVTFLVQEGKIDDAITSLEGKWQRYPPAAIAQFAAFLADANAVKKEQFQRGEAVLLAALEKYDRAAPLLAVLADGYAARQRYNEAESLYREVLQKKPNDVVVMNNLAMMLAGQGSKLDEALQFINRAIDIYGPEASMLDTRATVYLALDRPKDALTDLKLACSYTNQSVQFFHLAQAYDRVGNEKEATEALKLAASLGLNAAALSQPEQKAFQEFQKKYLASEKK
jgi:tetratricopeptide (TPR) repeat protein